MAWIESHQALERHPKTHHLMALMGWDIDTTIGKLHRFWWWCLDYAIDGDLRKFPPDVLASAVSIPSSDAQKFLEAMIASHFIENKPYLRVHDWWAYVRNFVQGRWNKTPEMWKKIEKLYTTHKGSRKVAGILLEGRRKLETPTVTYLPTVTNHNLPTNSPLISPQMGLNGFDTFWAAYPQKEGRGKAEEAWKKKAKGIPLEIILAGLEKWKGSQKWADGFVTMPATWLNQCRWKDDPLPVSPLSSVGQRTHEAGQRLLQKITEKEKKTP